ncbi:hypothetical protein HL666_20045 [Bradyrhizobium sp. 83002]|uniref:hypothetical protein n=1 Tax=Bradyrhizobium aeschynomenes TaxID=2734909 RepID=UPI0015550AB7|nr:hypothetical protein [Bradyrhizobium aeschynomenes]NPU13065.1 hypothetical protein [Bradyrhizobium aeschynomenes]
MAAPDRALHGATTVSRIVAAAFWSMLVGLLLASGWLLLTACGMSFWGVQEAFCPRRSAMRPDSAASELDGLFRRVQELERQVGERPQCRAEGARLPDLRQPLAPSPMPRKSDASPSLRGGEAAFQQACIGPRAEQSAAVIVLDGSRSMLLPYDIDPARDKDLHDRQQRGDATINEEYNQAISGADGRRIDIARAAILETIAASRGSAHVVTFDGCNSIQSGSGADGVNLIRTLAPKAGTPIADSLRRAAQLVPPGTDGRSNGNITLVTDGAESCHGDPCAAAREIKKERPGIVINVVDIAGWTDIACVARETGGFVRRGGRSINLVPLLKDALSQQSKSDCEGAIERPRQ